MHDKPKRIFIHCQEVYKKMLERSEPQAEFQLYTGYLTKLITEDLELPNSYYSFVTKELIRMDCIRNIQRGGGTSPSQWLLMKAPNTFDFENMPDVGKKLTKTQEEDKQFKANVLERLDRLELKAGIVSGPTTE